MNAGQQRNDVTGVPCPPPPHGSIRAIDIETGETLWSTVLPAGGQATPIIYKVDGRRYVMVTARGHHFMETPGGHAVMTWALPEQ
ncbi:Glycerol dehydrogenase large subunit precursor [Sulfitobacter sp. THAF37]|uniref:hypothetical protein n=1 Tax=Sulfitobacter sp. THAF37 TaxID=2587855 RepID=UPI0012AA6960|nr:hypothetical protein [Sulfitobacter sp. THAF37]QFT59394.1 Glycerol dehydrogenase large subunit precursor [Sulfitobacter sp. THAF37]